MAGKTTKKSAAKKKTAKKSAKVAKKEIAKKAAAVRKAVKWNSPFYGVEGQGWFLNFHTFTNYVKVAFFRGTSLRPVPPAESKHEKVRYLDIHEDDQLDEAQMATWVRQAVALPGWLRSRRWQKSGRWRLT